jgi:hypothetical protein
MQGKVNYEHESGFLIKDVTSSCMDRNPYKVDERFLPVLLLLERERAKMIERMTMILLSQIHVHQSRCAQSKCSN